MSQLAPPNTQKHEKDDPGAHELAESSDDHFSDASEGQRSRSNTSSSSVPVTRVERVDDEPRYGEIPGTSAYKMRTQDAVPDEIEVVPDGQRSRSHSRLSESDRPFTPGGTIIPKTIVEKVEPDKPSYGEVPGTEAYEKRRADADPDEILVSPIKARQNLEGEPTTSRSSSEPHTSQLADEQGGGVVDELAVGEEEEGGEGEHVDEDFGDDFDDFEEGENVDADDFDDDFETQLSHETPRTEQPVTPFDPLADLPMLDFSTISDQDALAAGLAPYLRELFPDHDDDDLTIPSSLKPPDPLLSDRSSSLWAQLVAPPPLQPPNWIKSRIRRLFLVSLGVPVDLDEILPASKQKKLVLPSLLLGGDSPRQSSQILRLKQGNDSSASVSTTDSRVGEQRKEKKRKDPSRKLGVPPPPKFDSNAASRISATTEAALQNFSDVELRDHVAQLEITISEANSVLEYWAKRKDSALGDKEAFEGVIENLVGFVAKSKAKR